MTELFIYIAFGLIVGYDVFAVIWQTKKEGKYGIVTITSVMRRWYKKPLVAFMIGGVFVGHFYLYQYNPFFSEKTSLFVFLGLAISFLIYTLTCQKTKIYSIMSKLAFIPLGVGAIVGSFWK